MFELSQSQNLELSILFILAYLVVMPFCKMNRDSLACLGAVVWSQAFCLSQMYNEMLISNAHHILTIYAIIYSVTITHLRSYRVMLACSAMVAAELVMLGAYNDGLFSESASDYVYSHYELVISVCHAGIVISLVRWNRFGFIAGRIRDGVLRFLSNCSMALRNGGEASYNSKSKINQEDKKCPK